MDVMIELNYYFQKDQNQPKDHQIWTRESVFLNYEPTCAYLIRSTLKQIAHPWKAINTSDLNLIWTSSWMIILFSYLVWLA